MTLFNKLVPTLTVLIAGAAISLGSPAKADPHRGVVIVSGGPVCRDDYRPAPDRDWAEREFQRGVNAARREGFDVGYHDGLSAFRFCDDVRISLGHTSGPF